MWNFRRSVWIEPVLHSSNLCHQQCTESDPMLRCSLFVVMIILNLVHYLKWSTIMITLRFNCGDVQNSRYWLKLLNEAQFLIYRSWLIRIANSTWGPGFAWLIDNRPILQFDQSVLLLVNRFSKFNQYILITSKSAYLIHYTNGEPCHFIRSLLWTQKLAIFWNG